MSSSIPEVFLITIITALIVALLIPNYILHNHRETSKQETIRVQTLEEIHNLLAPKHTTEEELLLERSIPNKRLVKAFKLTNTFVSPDPDVHRNFVKEARYLINNFDWQDWISMATRATQATLPKESQEFDSFVQAVTIRTVIAGLLKLADCPCQLAEFDVHEATQLINQIWLDSKEQNPRGDAAALHQLNHHLQNLNMKEKQLAFPVLDFIVPAYETLWRVVATTVAMINDRPELRRVFDDLNDHPTIEQVEFSGNASGVSARHVIQESMRLYPPVRRIYRAVLLPTNALGKFLSFLGLPRQSRVSFAADVEAISRSPHLWGPHASQFDPSRFARLSVEQKRAQLAFGAGKMKCVAAAWAEKAAALVVAAISAQTSGPHFKVDAGVSVGGRAGWEGWAVKRR